MESQNTSSTSPLRSQHGRRRWEIVALCHTEQQRHRKLWRNAVGSTAARAYTRRAHSSFPKVSRKHGCLVFVEVIPSGSSEASWKGATLLTVSAAEATASAGSGIMAPSCRVYGDWCCGPESTTATTHARARPRATSAIGLSVRRSTEVEGETRSKAGAAIRSYFESGQSERLTKPGCFFCRT
jgi:hypothetical protein